MIQTDHRLDLSQLIAQGQQLSGPLIHLLAEVRLFCQQDRIFLPDILVLLRQRRQVSIHGVKLIRQEMNRGKAGQQHNGDPGKSTQRNAGHDLSQRVMTRTMQVGDSNSILVSHIQFYFVISCRNR